MASVSTLLMTCASFLLTAATIGNAFIQKKQFYPAVVYITKSSPSMAVMYIQALVVAYMIFQVVRKLFFGQLRVSETEHLSERTWHAVMETCLAFTVFRDDFSPRFVMQFVLLLFVKSFHWLSEDRVDFMERSPIITVLFHCRMIGLLAFLSSLDSYFVSHAYFTTLLKGASVQIVFGFEYAILMTIVFHVLIKYLLHMYDLRSVHPWENKAVYLLYSELLINLLRCILYTVFAGVMIRLHTFPLFSIRPLYLTIRAFHKAVNDVILSRRAIHAMNNLFPLATEQELTDGDNTCIICREEMTPMSGAKKLPCNHIFHANCLRSWFQRQQSCPTCRTDILAQRRANTTTPAAARPAGAPAAADGAPGGAGAPAAGAAQPGNIPEQPPIMFPFMAHHFGFPPPLQQQPQPAQNQAAAPGATAQGQRTENQPSNTTDQAGTSTNSTQQQGNTATVGAQPPFVPPFGFIPPPPLMMIPPPIPFPFPQPPSFAGLTDAEVAAMEGQERVAVEARVNCLRNIAVLLDAATIQLQQYVSIVQALSVPHVGDSGAAPQSTPSNTTSSTTGAATVAADSSGTHEAAAAASSSSKPGPSGVVNSGTNLINGGPVLTPPKKTSAPNTTTAANPFEALSATSSSLSSGTSKRAGSQHDNPSNSVSKTSSTDSVPSPASSLLSEPDMSDLRQRRLQKFAHSTSSNSDVAATQPRRYPGHEEH